MISKFYATIFAQLFFFTLFTFVSGTGLKHMRAHGKEDKSHPVHSSLDSVDPIGHMESKKAQIRTIHVLNNQSIDGVYVDGLPIFVKFHKTGKIDHFKLIILKTNIMPYIFIL